MNRTKLLYCESILERNHHPHHHRDIPEANCVLRGVNASCGDDIIIKLLIDENGIIRDGAYDGYGCAISRASADIMLDIMIGRTEEEAGKLADDFMAMLKGEITPETAASLQGASVFRDIRRTPSRIKCAALAWEAVQAGINARQS